MSFRRLRNIVSMFSGNNHQLRDVGCRITIKFESPLFFSRGESSESLDRSPLESRRFDYLCVPLVLSRYKKGTEIILEYFTSSNFTLREHLWRTNERKRYISADMMSYF